MSNMRQIGMVPKNNQSQYNFFANNAVLGGEIINFFTKDIPDYIKESKGSGDDVETSFSFAEDQDKDFGAMVNVIKKQAEKPPSKEMQRYFKTVQENGGGYLGVIKAFAENPKVAPEAMITSLIGMIRATGSDKASKYAALAGFAGLATGGPVRGAQGLFAGLSMAVETTSKFSELLAEELKDMPGGITEENLKKLVADEARFQKLKNKAYARGTTIGLIDFATGFATTKVAGKVAERTGSKLLATGAGAVVEGFGGGFGEAAGSVVIGEDVDPAAVGLEVFAEYGRAPIDIGGALLRPSKPAEYFINNQKVSFGEMRNFVNTADDMQVAMANIRMKNDFTGIGKKAAAKQEAARKSVELSGDTQTIADVEAVKAEQRAGQAEQDFQANMAFAKKHSKLFGLKFTTLTQDQIKERFKNTENAELSESLGGVIGDEIIINKTLAKTRVYGKNVGNHELLHAIIKASGQQKLITQATIDDFLNVIGKDNAAKVQKRLDDNYTKEYVSQNLDEYFTAFSDAIANNEIVFNDSIFTQVKDVMRRLFASVGIANVDFQTGRGAYNFLKDYNKSIHKGSLSFGIKQKVKGPVKIEQSKFSKEASDKVQDLYNRKGVDGAFEIMQEFKPIVDRIAENRRGAPNFDKELLMSEIEIGERGILDLVGDYNPESADYIYLDKNGKQKTVSIIFNKKGEARVNNEKNKNLNNATREDIQKFVTKNYGKIVKRKQIPLAAYINKFLPARAIEASRRVLGKEFTVDVEEARDVLDEPSTTPRKKQISTKKIEGIAIALEQMGHEDVMPKLRSIYNENFKNVSRLKTYKDIKNAIYRAKKEGPFYQALVEVSDIFTNENFTAKELAKRIRIKQDLTLEMRKAIQNKILKHSPEMITMVPDGTSADGDATGIANTKLGMWYDKRGRSKFADTGTGKGLAVQQKRGLNNETFLTPFGLAVKGQRVTDKSVDGALREWVMQVSTLAMNQASRQVNPNLKGIKKGKNVVQFSKSNVKKFAEENGFDMEKDFYYPGDSVEDANRYFEDIQRIHAKFGDGFLNANNINRAFDKLKDKAVKKHIRNIFNNFDFGDAEANGFVKREFSRHMGKSEKNPVLTGKKIEKNIDKVKIFNDQVEKNFKHMWTKINEMVNEDRSLAIPLMYYLQSSTTDRSHPQRAGATYEGHDTTYSGDLYFEHALQNANTFNGLMQVVLGKAKDINGNTVSFKDGFKVYRENYKLIGVSVEANNKLNKTRYIDNNGKPVSYAGGMGKDWNIFDGGMWWQRYFNADIAFNPDNFIFLKNGKNFTQELGAVNFSQSGSIQQAASVPFANARTTAKYSKSSRGMSTFDFDETLIIEGKNFITATKGKDVVKISSAEWPIVGQQYQDAGYSFDFSDFVNVRGGIDGPLLQKMRNQIKKFGPNNVFVLTARPPESATAIHGWLKSKNINIPLENITGLGNSSGEAKAVWMLNKFAEGYNDMYFVDDALPNVKAVKQALEQLDIKSNVQQARIKFSKSINEDFNSILEDVSGIKSERRYSDARANKAGEGKGSFRFFVPPSHEDFAGLLYNFMGKGKLGNKHREFFERTLLKPLARGYRELNMAKQAIANDYRVLLSKAPLTRKKLRRKIPGSDYYYSDAVRVYLWNKAGFEIPGISQTEVNELIDVVNSSVNLRNFANVVSKISRQKEGYIEPSENWQVGDIRTDLADATGRVGRKRFFNEYLENSKIIFSKENLNKIEAAYGADFRSALEDMLYRIEKGSNRPTGQNKNVNLFLDYINGSIGATMFFNARSAVLQTISTVNFINFGDNNIFKAAEAFSNQEQFWTDFKTLFNSDMLKQRRAGVAFDLNASEIASAVSKAKTPTGKARAAIAYLLQIGFLPTQLADSFAIAFGGATMYRNRVETYIKQGFTQQQAETKAFEDFQEISESTQQSARPDKISQQQASVLGRLILAFQNTPSQYVRLMKKAGSDLINRRISKGYTNQARSDMSNISKIIYYGAVQNVIFYSLQSALFAMLFGEDEEDEEKTEKFFKTKKQRVINGSIDTVLRGAGIAGAVISTIKNTAIKYAENQKKDWGKEDNIIMMELLQLSPPIGIKARKYRSYEKTMDYNKKVIDEMDTFDVNNPIWDAYSQIIEAATNVPLARLYRKVDNLRAAVDTENAWWQRLATGLGWSRWDVGVKDKEVEEVKERIKKSNKSRNKKRGKLIIID